MCIRDSNNAMLALTHEDPQQPNTPLSVCVAMSQAYIGYDLQNALREELLNRNITDIPVATMITQAVSYTHLDVYKRQEVKKARAFHESFPQYTITPLTGL